LETVLKNKKILFIGNSYTDGFIKSFEEMIENSVYKNSKFEYIWGGGVTLHQLIKNGRALEGLQRENWDAVVLQEQSQLPAIPGKCEQSFHESVDILVNEIKAKGAKAFLYMTWGRRDKDEENPELFPNYKSMQSRLTEAYETAAERNDINVIAVGKAWSKLRNLDSELGRELYQQDGSHPSDKGAFLISCMMIKKFFNEKLNNLYLPMGVNELEAETIVKAINS
jgi:hypothetical protein